MSDTIDTIESLDDTQLGDVTGGIARGGCMPTQDQQRSPWWQRTNMPTMPSIPRMPRIDFPVLSGMFNGNTRPRCGTR